MKMQHRLNQSTKWCSEHQVERWLGSNNLNRLCLKLRLHLLRFANGRCELMAAAEPTSLFWMLQPYSGEFVAHFELKMTKMQDFFSIHWKENEKTITAWRTMTRYFERGSDENSAEERIESWTLLICSGFMLLTKLDARRLPLLQRAVSLSPSFLHLPVMEVQKGVEVRDTSSKWMCGIANFSKLPFSRHAPEGTFLGRSLWCIPAKCESESQIRAWKMPSWQSSYS